MSGLSHTSSTSAKTQWAPIVGAILLVITFLLVKVAPSDPAAILAGENATPEQIALIREQYGFDRPLHVQFVRYVFDVVRLDFGTSQFSNRSVFEDLIQRLPATLELTMSALLVSALLGIPLGTIAATHHNRWPDFAIRIFSVIGIGVAAFWFAILLQLLFSMELRWLPLRGRLSNSIEFTPDITRFMFIDSLLAGRFDVFRDAVLHAVQPVITLAVCALATIIRFTRAGVLETLQTDFVLYERAVGYSSWRLTWVYVLKNSIIATIMQLGLLFGAMIAGAVVVEAIFDWPGIGNYTVEAILNADYNVILGVTLLIGVIYAAVNILADAIHGLIDPRVREQL